MAPPGPRKRPARAYVLPALFVGALFFSLWSRRPQFPTGDRYQLALSGPIMGTTFSVKIVTDEETDAATDERLQQAVVTALESVNQSMSTWLDDSEITRFNEHQSTEPFPLSSDFLTVLGVAQDVSDNCDGAFDVTIRPLVSLWKFGSNAADWDNPPNNAEIALQLGQVGHHHLHLNNDSASKDIPQLTIDLGAIAKGFGVDKVGEALEQEGIESYMVEVGGEVRTRGLNVEHRPWQIGIETPDALQGTVEARIELSGMSLATSGDYRNYYEDEDGNRISHTIDARTGRPISHHLASVSVIDAQATVADAWATALHVLGPVEGMRLAETQGMPVMMLVREAPGQFAVRTSENFDDYRVMQ